MVSSEQGNRWRLDTCGLTAIKYLWVACNMCPVKVARGIFIKMLKHSRFFPISGLQPSVVLVNPVTVTKFIAFLSKSIDFSLK